MRRLAPFPGVHIVNPHGVALAIHRLLGEIPNMPRNPKNNTKQQQTT
jgi:hypothetical protein